MHHSVVAIVPAYNEGDRIEATVRSLQTTGRVDTVLVVDDGSCDQTAEKARAAGAMVLRLDVNGGKTRALDHGVRHSDHPVLLLVDADLGETAGLTTQLLEPIVTGTADMAIAAWPSAGGAGGFGIIKRVSTWMIRLVTGRTIHNPLSGQRAMSREVWACWRGSIGYGFEVALTIDALRAGKRVVEIPLHLTHRHMGRSWAGFVHRGRQLCHILLTVGRRCFAR